MPIVSAIFPKKIKGEYIRTFGLIRIHLDIINPVNRNAKGIMYIQDKK